MRFIFSGKLLVDTSLTLSVYLLLSVLSNTMYADGVASKTTYEPLDPPPAVSNVFYGAETRASGHWSNQTPDLAVNGDLSVDNHWAAENLPVWHEVVLKEPESISMIKVWPYWADGRVYRYKVEGSLDGENWFMLADQTANTISSSPDGDVFKFAPIEVSIVRTTFIHNSAGAESGGHLVQIEGYRSAPETGLIGQVGSIDKRYAPSGRLDLPAAEEGLDLVAWRGERVNAQVVVSSDSEHKSLRFETASLSSEAGSIDVQARFVRYVLADGVPQGDILDTAEVLDLAAGANRPVWIKIDVPQDSQPGVYEGGFVVRSDSGTVDFPIRLEVIDAKLPPPGDWQVHLDLWQHPDAVARWHDVPLWSDEHLALMKPGMIRLANAGQKTITAAIIHEAWNGQTYDDFPSKIRWIKLADGSWEYDYTIFDKWVEFMTEEIGLENARIHCYSMLPWGLTFRYHDETEQRDVDVTLQPGSEEYDEFWGIFLRDFKSHLRTKGWLERTLIAMDERPDAQMLGAMATLERHAPEFRIHSAINRPSDITSGIFDISPIIQHAENMSADLISARRDNGKVTTFYVCTAPPIPNTFTFSPPAEAEWLMLYAAAKGFDGFLRWAYQSWVENPLVSTDYVRWPSGDCFLVYPGDRSSIRFERLRDGIENFEKIRLLREHYEQAPSAELAVALAELDDALAVFKWDDDQQKRLHRVQVERVNEAILNAALSMPID